MGFKPTVLLSDQKVVALLTVVVVASKLKILTDCLRKSYACVLENGTGLYLNDFCVFVILKLSSRAGSTDLAFALAEVSVCFSDYWCDVANL